MSTMANDDLRNVIKRMVTSICTICGEEGVTPKMSAVAIGATAGCVLRSIFDETGGTFNTKAARDELVRCIDGVLSGEMLEYEP